MAIFYGNAFYLYPRFLNKRFWWLYILLSATLIIGAFRLKYHILATWFPQVLEDATTVKFVFGPTIVFFIISLVYRKVIDQLQFEHEFNERRAAQLETELKFLRAQINPHFLFNVLTNFASLARKKSDKLEPSLIMLSDLMRYTVYEAQGSKVDLQKEIGYLDNYIQLQKLRFGNEVHINYSTELDNQENRYIIEPMLLIPFVENAFKHGAGYLEQSWILIRLSVKGGVMTFEVCNNYEPTSIAGKYDNSGIGILNVRSRLDLLYKNNYTLLINDENHIFHIILTLTLL
jgi:LytS/YehU family sensor histidine kinase